MYMVEYEIMANDVLQAHIRTEFWHSTRLPAVVVVNLKRYVNLVFDRPEYESRISWTGCTPCIWGTPGFGVHRA